MSNTIDAATSIGNFFEKKSTTKKIKKGATIHAGTPDTPPGFKERISRSEPPERASPGSNKILVGLINSFADQGRVNSAGISMNAKNLRIRESSAVIRNLTSPALRISSRRLKIELQKSPIKISVQIARKIEENAASSEASSESEYVLRQLKLSKSRVRGIKLNKIGASIAITRVPSRP